MTTENQNHNDASGNDSINRAAQAAHETVDKMASAAESARESTSKVYTIWEQRLRDCTKDRPFQSLFCAIGVGIVLGRLIK